MIPCLEARGDSIAEVWDQALLSLWEDGMMIRTQYDFDPNTGITKPPSKDCSMRMIVKNSLAEPRLHICLEGGPEQLGDYETEVVLGLKDDWVKNTTDPEDKRWIYTYHGRLAAYGNRLNFASSIDDPGRSLGGWTSLAYSRPVFRWEGGDDEGPGRRIDYQDHEEIEPFDQIEFIVQQLVKAPYTRRAVAMTGFPPADAQTDEPPCLREAWCRGYHEDGVLKIDMHTHWRSRDAWGAALFNMYALTELHRDICLRVQKALDDKERSWLVGASCPLCTTPMVFEPEINHHLRRDTASDVICKSCGLRPYKVAAGAYVDTSDSFHVYGTDMVDFEERFIRGVHGLDPKTGERVAPEMPLERCFKDLTQDPWAQMLDDGRKKAIHRAMRGEE
jgi:thymidylate synthase